MAYSIRYALQTKPEISNSGFALRALTAAGLAAGVALARLCWSEGTILAERLLAAPPEGTAEIALSALAQVLADGEGWYRALAVWCRTILDAGMA